MILTESSCNSMCHKGCIYKIIKIDVVVCHEKGIYLTSLLFIGNTLKIYFNHRIIDCSKSVN